MRTLLGRMGSSRASNQHWFDRISWIQSWFPRSNSTSSLARGYALIEGLLIYVFPFHTAPNWDQPPLPRVLRTYLVYPSLNWDYSRETSVICILLITVILVFTISTVAYHDANNFTPSARCHCDLMYNLPVTFTGVRLSKTSVMFSAWATNYRRAIRLVCVTGTSRKPCCY